MALLLQILISGVAVGAVYGVVAIGYALIYRLTGVIHFALGELVGLTVFATLYFAAGTGTVTRSNLSPGRFLLSLAGGCLVAVVAGVLLYLVAVRPFLGNSSAIGWIGATVAMTFVVRGSLEAAFRRESYVFPDPFPFSSVGRGGILVLGDGATLPVRTFLVMGVAIALAATAAWLLSSTKMGRGLRALSSDREAAALMGVPVDRSFAFAFAIAGVLAGIAAVVAAPQAPVTVGTAALLGLKGLVAAMFGRFELPWRVLLAGIGLGILEVVISSGYLRGWHVLPAYRDLVPLALAIGLFALGRARLGRAEVE